MSRAIYLDWNATTPPAPEVLAAMHRAAERSWGNPSSVHAVGREARRALEDTREALAQLLELSPRDVVLTGGGTEANNLMLRSAPGLALSRLEHPSVVRVAERIETDGRPVVWLPVRPDGQLEVAAIAEHCRALPEGSWLSLMAVNHETGVIQPLEAAAEAARPLGLKLHSDAVQALGKVPLGPLQVADAITVAAHKIRGPKGIGALALRARAGVVPVPRPVLVGGAQERGLRPGTQDAVAAAGFGAALARLPVFQRGILGVGSLRDALERGIQALATPNGSAPRAPHVTNLHFPAWRGDELVAALDLAGVQVSAGSACSAGSLEPSPVLLAMGRTEAATHSVRFSLGEDTTAADVDEVLRVLRQLLAA